MKQTLILSTLAFLASCVSASPTPTVQDDAIVDPRSIEKRAAITDAADVGYATQNGGYEHILAIPLFSWCSLADFTFSEPLEAAVAPPRLCLHWLSSRPLSDPAALPLLSSAEPSRDPPRSRSPLTSPSSASPAAVRVDPSSWKESFCGMADQNQNVALTGVGLTINGQSNVIVRNLKISKVLADNGDAITIQASKNVWVDHVDLSSDLDHDKDYYDGLVDVTHASEWVTISNSYIHDHVSIGIRLLKRKRNTPFLQQSREEAQYTHKNLFLYSTRPPWLATPTPTAPRTPVTCTSPTRTTTGATSTRVPHLSDSAPATSSSKSYAN